MDVVPRKTSRQILEAFKQDILDESIIYFFCHGAFFKPEKGQNADASYFELGKEGEEDQLSLGLLRDKAPDNGTFKKNQLVFMNACETAGIYPIFVTGFLHYFLVKGARADNRYTDPSACRLCCRIRDEIL